MSYMRGQYYTWRGTNGINLPTEMPMETFDELCAMRWAQLTEEEKKAAQERAVENYSGNVGCDELCQLLGKPGTTEIMEEMLRNHKDGKA